MTPFKGVPIFPFPQHKPLFEFHYLELSFNFAIRVQRNTRSNKGLIWEVLRRCKVMVILECALGSRRMDEQEKRGQLFSILD